VAAQFLVEAFWIAYLQPYSINVAVISAKQYSFINLVIAPEQYPLAATVQST
jgi:hypothetical protein